MGCGGSRSSGDREIQYNMEWIASSDINSFFSSCEAVLERAENIRAGLEDTSENMFDLTAVNYLKAPPSLLDAVKVFLWAISANNGG